MKYDSSIKHIIYDVLDFKSESIGQYFDIAAYQIKKCNLILKKGCSLEVFSCIVEPESQGYTYNKIVSNFSDCLSDQIQQYDLQGGTQAL